MDKEIKDILSKYQSKLNENIKIIDEYNPESYTVDYRIFRDEALSRTLTSYEAFCNIFEKILKVKVKENDYKELQRSIETSHIQINPEGAASFGFFITGFLIFISLILGGYFFYIARTELLLLPALIILIAAFCIKPLTNIPNFLAARWRLRASNQMVLCILYIVMYMRHTSNLEHAVKFASDH